MALSRWTIWSQLRVAAVVVRLRWFRGFASTAKPRSGVGAAAAGRRRSQSRGRGIGAFLLIVPHSGHTPLVLLVRS